MSNVVEEDWGFVGDEAGDAWKFILQRGVQAHLEAIASRMHVVPVGFWVTDHHHDE